MSYWKESRDHLLKARTALQQYKNKDFRMAIDHINNALESIEDEVF